MNQIPLRAAFLFLITIMLGSCISLDDLIRKPEVSIVQVVPTAINFQDITLEMELLVSNPNPVEINLEGYNYHLQVDESSLVQGRHDDPLTLEANGSSTILVPVTVNYEELYRSIQSLTDSRESSYRISTGLQFMLPVLGEQTLNLSHEGTIPHVKRPLIDFDAVLVERLGLTGADILVVMSAENPNAFDFSLNNLKGSLYINRTEWADLNSLEAVKFPSGEKSEMKFRFSLDFINMGLTLYEIIREDNTVDYNLDGEILLASSLPLLEETTLPLSLSGSVPLTKPEKPEEKKEETIVNQIENMFNIFNN